MWGKIQQEVRLKQQARGTSCKPQKSYVNSTMQASFSWINGITPKTSLIKLNRTVKGGVLSSKNKGAGGGTESKSY